MFRCCAFALTLALSLSSGSALAQARVAIPRTQETLRVWRASTQRVATQRFVDPTAQQLFEPYCEPPCRVTMPVGQPLRFGVSLGESNVVAAPPVTLRGPSTLLFRYVNNEGLRLGLTIGGGGVTLVALVVLVVNFTQPRSDLGLSIGTIVFSLSGLTLSLCALLINDSAGVDVLEGVRF